MKKDLILCMFDDSGNLFDDWIAVGYKVMCVDVSPLALRAFKPGTIHVQADPRQPWAPPVPLERFAFVSAHPPCDHLAVSGSRWFKGKGLRLLADSVHMFATAAEVCEALGVPYMVENPVSTVSTYWREPDHIYSPYQYSAHDPLDYYTKPTCLWTGGGFVMPDHAYDEGRFERGVKQRLAVLRKHGSKRAAAAEVQAEMPDYPDSRIFNAGGALKSHFRSVTPKGFGRAVFLSNCPEAAFG